MVISERGYQRLCAAPRRRLLLTTGSWRASAFSSQRLPLASWLELSCLFILLYPVLQERESNDGCTESGAPGPQKERIGSDFGAVFAAASLCSEKICVNGTCYEHDTQTPPFYKCDCGDFFTGDNCETHNNPCTSKASNPCGQGTCTFAPGRGSGTVTCTCNDGYETAPGASMTTIKWGDSQVLQAAPCTVQSTRGAGSRANRSSDTNSGSNTESSRPSASTGGKSNGTAGVPQKGNREAANRLKDLGNESFRRCMYGLATEYYSKAIAIDATVASYFTNRALCHKRQNRYPEALQDADAALALDKTNIKGLYIKGDALVQLGNLDEGVSLLQEAEKASSLGTGRAAFEIPRKLRHDLCQKQRSAERTDVVAFLKECIDTVAEHRQLPEEEVQERHAQLEQLVAEAEKADAPFETPDFLTCRISMVPSHAPR
ncbi:TPR domain-containing protein [Cyclospora cayetanensis]|uniref:RING-type E3 ubiquitin transferase n=1 Tax=Cyclospora cayetanensis TaxID=88456 RepID=A0A1D3CZ95_9EIME|nr:TPR domain-containing protein [Cyclospora cayetanensis]